MNKGIVVIIILTTFSMLFIMACEKEGDGNETKISYNNLTESHQTGKECMSCHQPGGSGEGWFIVAGTVYDELKETPYPNAIIKIYTGPQGSGELVSTIEVDGKGNFYSTENINFDTGLYTLVESNTSTRHMASKITNGNCNSCHGNNHERIWIDN